MATLGLTSLAPAIPVRYSLKDSHSTVSRKIQKKPAANNKMKNQPSERRYLQMIDPIRG